MEKQFLAQRPVSDHPGDHYLSIVLHKNFKGEYVTHLYNSEDKGLYCGHYHGDDYDKALEDFKNRE